MPPEPSDARDLSIDAKLRMAFELSPTVLAITTAGEGRLLEVNDAFLALHGYTRAEVIGRTVSELDLWVDPRQRREALTAIRAGSPVRNLEARLRTKDGSERVCLINADLVVVDGHACILTALTDITDRVRSEDALRESEQRFLLAFHANPLPMSITRLDDGRHLEVNEAALRHGGFTREEMLGHTKAALGFWIDAAQRDAMLRELHEHGRVRDFQVTSQTRSGERRQLLVNSALMRFGGVPAVLNVSIDITDRIRADRAKDEFLAMLGHELRNPLGTIRNAMALLEASPHHERDREVIAVVSRQTAQLTRLVDDLLNMSRLTSGNIQLRRQMVDVHALARRCLDALRHSGRTARHDVTLDGPPVYVDGDPARLEQIVNNLLDNALKYTPPGGRVTVTTEVVGDEAVLCVRDNGQGIDPALLPRVFDLFVQAPQGLDRAEGGLGLGLAVVKGLTDLHGGSVSVHSEGIGRGSEFTIRLKAAGAPLPPAHATAAHEGAARGPRRRVLVVEDNADAREVLKVLLESSGHVVETAADGPAGLEALRAFRPDIALIDVGLPGFDGYALVRSARQHRELDAVRLVAVTGYGQEDDREHALAAGFDRHVTKPVDPDALDQLVSDL